jgi:5-methyltetrahydrofolate--homocysteine methyltransferase
MGSITARLANEEILVADGAMGSLLFQRGLKQGDCPESLNSRNPELLEEIARLYLMAGSDIVQTNTFGGSPLKLAEYGLEEKTEELNKAAAACVRRCVGSRAFVSGSCGPSGGILKPYGSADPEDLYHGFKRQMGALIDAGVDVICVETMTDVNEATLAVRAAKAISAKIPVMATMTFDETPRGFFTIMGVGIGEAARELEDAGADIVGSNCGNGIENMVKIAREFRAASDLPVLIQSNAGLPEMRSGAIVYPETPEYFAEQTEHLISAGASIIGGCCGTTPDHIRAVRQAVDSRRRSSVD